MNPWTKARAAVLIVLSANAVLCESLATEAPLQSDPGFKGHVAVSVKDSVPAWPESPQAPSGAPNIVLILLDDIGFADASTFGGIAQTPELEKLAANGLRYNNFNTTGMCSPTRAALLTGRNHHRVGFGLAEGSAGYPGYNFYWKKNTVSVAEILRRNGYSTAAFGKWHNTPYHEVSPIGPFERWPTNLGFEQFYGFIAGRDSQWEPSSLYRNTTPVEAPASTEAGYHFTQDIADEAIRWLRTHASLAPQKPYFLYFATGAVHSPHHAPAEWIERYRGRFDQGWDALRREIFASQKRLGVVPPSAELTPRPAGVPAWSSLSANQRKLYARQMEVYAGFVAHTDYEIGRLLKAVNDLPGSDNTLVLYVVGDNGPSPGGGADGGVAAGLKSLPDKLAHLDELGAPTLDDNDYAIGWTWLGATPFKGWKMIPSHFGGTRAPLVVSWPAGIKDRGGMRSQFAHVNDVAATLYEVSGISLPSRVDGTEQQPLDGVSFAATFDHADVRLPSRTQYFEILGNRAIYQDGWVAAAAHSIEGLSLSSSSDYARDRWELYYVTEDFTESANLAGRNPVKLRELQQLFDREARANDVYPLGASENGGVKPSLTDGRREFVYYPGLPRLQIRGRPPLQGQSYRITARAVIPESGAQGALVSFGGRESGFAFYVKDDRLIYENLRAHDVRELIESSGPLPRGQVDMTFEYLQESVQDSIGWFSKPSTGIGRLFINGQIVGESRLSQTLGAGYDETFGVGEAFGPAVSAAFRPPFRFTGTLKQVKIELR